MLDAVGQIKVFREHANKSALEHDNSMTNLWIDPSFKAPVAGDSLGIAMTVTLLPMASCTTGELCDMDFIFFFLNKSSLWWDA